MEDGERTKISCGRFLLLLSQGVIMGIGAVLPGISGGVLCVIFGIYQPMMETLAHPKKGIKKPFCRPYRWDITAAFPRRSKAGQG